MDRLVSFTLMVKARAKAWLFLGEKVRHSEKRPDTLQPLQQPVNEWTTLTAVDSRKKSE